MKIKLKQLLKQKHYTAMELGRVLDVSETTVYSWMHRNRSIKYRYLDKICKLFKCKLTDVIDVDN